MANTDVFAFQKSALAAFLYAEVGTEIGGSLLTVLSVMARLGQDPWEEAARWVQLPRDEIVDRLTQGIVQMPVSEQALLNARETAERLVQLLPSRAIHSETAATSASGRARLTGWTPVYVAMTLLAVAVLASQLVGRS